MSSSHTSTPLIAVIGAGPTGLIQTHVLLSSGFTDVTIIEKHDNLGGVWADGRRYGELVSNNNFGLYEFSKMGMDKDMDSDGFVKGEDIKKYLDSYAKKFDLEKHIRYSTTVLSITQSDPSDLTSPWLLQLSTPNGPSTETYDKIVVCIGVHSDAFVPTYPSRSVFSGSVYHTQEIDKPAVKADLAKKERIVVVGMGKSATDAASWLAGTGKHVTILYRHLRWLTPRRVMGGLASLKYVLYNRFVYSFTPYHTHTTWWRRFLHTNPLGKIIVSAFWAGLREDMIFTNGAGQKGLVPPISPYWYASTIGLAHKSYYQYIKEGKITPVQGEITSYSETGLETTTGPVAADAIIFGTGQYQRYPFSSPELTEKLGLTRPSTPSSLAAYNAKKAPHVAHLSKTLTLRNPPPDLVKIPHPSNPSPLPNLLHRHAIPIPWLNARTIAFNGTVDAIDTILVSEIQSHYIADYFANTLPTPLPSQQEAESQALRAAVWMERRYMPTGATGTVVGLDYVQFVDELMGDMG
ncbi:hypothetical protein HK104_005021, partial [Borealophlyctis nickersoniae]